jgi:peptide/nickel transport system substrate-binding protein
MERSGQDRENDMGNGKRWCGAALLAAMLAASGAAVAQNKADTLRIGLNAGNTFLGDPTRARGVPSIYFKQVMYNSITNIDPDGAIVADLAESWRLVDALTWRFKIRSNVPFTNGTKNDATNVVRWMDWVLNTNEGRATQFGGVLKDVASATVVDGDWIEVKTKVPQPILAAVLSEFFVVEAKAWVDVGVQQYAPRPITSGPWRVISYTIEEMRGVEFENAFKKPKVKNIVLLGMQEAATRVQAIVSDQMDVTTNMGPDDIKVFQSAGHRAETADAPQTMTIAFYEQKAGPNPFKDRRVRVAANMAINRDDIVRGLMSSLTKPAHQAVTPKTFGYDPTIPPYPYDPAAARRMLAEAGYANGFDDVLQVTTGSLPFDKEIYTLVGDQLGRIGIRTKVVPINLGDLADMLFKRSGKDFEGRMFGFSAFVDPYLDAERPFQQYGCTFKPSWICLANIEELRDKANATMDRNEREKILKQLVRLAHDEGVGLHIQHGVDIYGVNKRVRNFKNWNRRLIFEDMEIGG